MVNRGIIILRYKQPFIDWINASDPYDAGVEVTLETANMDKNVYLISDADADNYQRWVSRNYQELFEEELSGWYNDETLWPKNRTKRLFNQWIEVECHSVLIDTVGGPIFDDGV